MKGTSLKSPTYTEAYRLWELLGDIPVNDQEKLDADFIIKSDQIPFNEITFEKGTDVNEVWHWFEETFNCSIVKDLQNHE